MIEKTFEKGIELGRISVLQDFDSICKADSFLGFSNEEWEAVRKFFAVNKKISGWDTDEELLTELNEYRKSL